jgi:prepilin-type processing-associated H-X9-DG protein
MKNLATGMLIYLTDADDMLPATRIVVNPGDWFGPNTLTWKDAIQPYIKNGGRPAGTGAFFATPGTGGIFQSPMNESAWSNDGRWFGSDPGDETTRYPRSYAANKDAGRNEFGGPRSDGRCADTIWQEIYPNGSGGQTVYNQGGNVGILQNVAGTAMLAPTRKLFPDIEVSEMARGCTATGNDNISTYPTAWSCVAGTQNRGLNFAFFDGHAKNINAVASVDRDVWGSLGPTGISACGWNAWWSGPGNGLPWIQGIKTNLLVINEYR